MKRVPPSRADVERAIDNYGSALAFALSFDTPNKGANAALSERRAALLALVQPVPDSAGEAK